MSFKVSTLCMIALLLSFVLTCASRPDPGFPGTFPMKTQHGVKDVEESAEMVVEVEERPCDQGVDEDECLMRRTLVAHTDYIYTQKNNP